MVRPLARPGGERIVPLRVSEMADSNSPPPDPFAARLRELRKRTGQDEREDEAAGPSSGMGAAMGLAFRVGIELAAGLVVGGGLGWLLDRWWGTGPAMLILFFFLGAVAGMVNVFRATRNMNRGS